MKTSLLLIFCAVFLIQACQVKSGGNPGDDLFSSHNPTSNQFTLTTILNKTYVAGETISFSLSFPKAVTVSGALKLDLVIGTTPREAFLTSGSGTSTLIFSYVVQNGEIDSDGISVLPLLNLNSGSCVYDGSKACGTSVVVPPLGSVKVSSVGVPSNTAPVVSDFSAPSFDEDTSSLITLPYTDTEGDKASSCSVSNLVKVSVTQACACDASGICKVGVTGLPNLFGGANFNYQVTANGQVSNSAKANFILNPVDDAPVANNITPPAFDKNVPSLIVLSYGDVDGDLATQCLISNPVNVTVTTPCSCTSGVCKLGVTGTTNYSGAASFEYQVRSNGVLSNTALASLTINNVDQPPVTANINPAAFDEDTAVYITLPYTDADGDLASECAVASLNKVTIVESCACVSGLCRVRVQGLPDYFGAASFAFAVKAGGVSSNVSTANLTINPVQDAPVSSVIHASSVDMNMEKTIQLVYTDAEGDLASTCAISSLVKLSVSTPCSCTVAGVCSVGVTGELDYSGPASFQYSVTAGGLTSNISLVDFTILAAGAPVAANSSISGITNIVADGVASSTITITLKDSNNNPVSGLTPTFSATDTGSKNIYGVCSLSSASGVSTCSLSSTRAESKILSLLTPVSKTGNTLVFIPGPPSATESTLTGTTPIVADEVDSSLITVTIKDAYQNPISGETPTFTATDTANKNVYGACSVTDSSGVSQCALSSLKPELKTLSLLTPVAFTGGNVNFISGAVSVANSSISGSGPVVADGVSASVITIVLKDANNNGVGGSFPVFTATDSDGSNVHGSCSMTNGSGASSCTLTSTKAELKTLSITHPITKADGTVSFIPGAPVAANSTLTGTSPVVADGVASSTISVVLKDVFQNPISGEIPVFSATDTGSKNIYGACSPTDASGSSACTLKSLQPETKTLSLTAPISFSGGTVVFTAGAAVAVNSTITGTGPVVANGSSTSIITITLKDSVNNPVQGIVPTFSATNTGSGNNYGTCSSTNASGVSTCTLSSTKSEIKTLSITSPVTKADGTVTFTAGAAVAANSNITGSGPVVADGLATSTITVTLMDVNNNPVSGTVPTFSATNTGTTNVYGACSNSDSSGISTCTLKSTRAQTKTLSLLTPVSKTGGVVTFIAGAAAASQSSITGTTPVSADGVSTSFVSVYIKDAFANPISGVVPIFNATDTNSTNVYGACQSSDSSGLSLCTLASTKAEAKTLQLTSPVAKTGDVVTFSSALPTAANSTIAGTTPVTADGSAFSTVTITLKDSNNNPVAGLTPTFDATNTGNGNTYGDCSLSDAGGVSSCTLSSTIAESKILRITSPVTKTGNTVVFTAGLASATNSTISGTGPVVADGVAVSTITIILKDTNNNAISGSTPTFGATNTGATNVNGACSATNASGVSTCTLTSTKAESKIPQILTPVVKSGTAISFIAGAASATNSTITGTGPTNPDGVSTSTITITLRDAFNNTISSIIPTFSATGSGNTYGICSSSNSSGVSTCTLASTAAEVKTLNLDTPVAKSGGTVTFASGSAVVANSSISSTGPVVANGVATSTITITLKDASNTPVISVVPTFSATGTSNNYGICSATNASGISTCTMTSTKAEVKTVSIDAPVIKPGNTVTFTPGPVSAVTTTIQASGPHLADGSDQSAVMITLLDAFSNPIQGTTPTFSVSGTSNTLAACSVSASSGISTCHFKSTKAEEKTVNLLSPVAVTGNTVDFNPQGISLQVPIEMIDKGVPSSTAIVTYGRSRTSLDTYDYVSQSNTFYWEIIADNTSTTTDYTVYLVDSAGVQIDDSAILIPASTTSPRRFRGDFTPNDGPDNYRIRIPATPTASQVKIHTSRIIVEQFKAVATKLYIPLTASDALTDTSNDTGGQASSTTSTSFLQPSVNNYYQYVRNDALHDTYASGTPWTLETVSSISNSLGTATVALFDKTTNLQIPEATTTVSGTTAISLRQVSFSSSASNFLNGSVLEARIRSSSTSYTTKVFKAGIWIKLKFLRKTEVPFRLVTRRSGGSTVTMGDGRFLWEPSAWSNPTTFFQVFGSVNTQTVQLLDAGAVDTGTAGTAISTITPTTAYGSQTSTALSLVNDSRYIIKQNRTSGTVIIGGAFVLVRTNE